MEPDHGDDRRVQTGRAKKLRRRLTSFYMGVGRTVPGFWSDIELARYLNRYLGTHLAPWELGGVPELYIEALLEGLALRDELAEAGLLKR